MSEVREGYKMTELGEIPIEWKVEKFRDLGTFKKGKGIAKKDLSDFGNQCILYGHLYTKYKEIIKKVDSFTNISPKNSVIGKVNDLLIPSSGETAIDIAISSALTVNNVLIGGDINLFTPSNEIDSRFLSYQINSIRKKDMAKLAQGSSVYHLYAPSLENFLLAIPSFREQQKIAEILSTVDTQIEQTEQMIEQTKELKHGLMQQLLTKGIGHTEFKESELGKIPVNWKIRALKDIAENVTIGLVTSMTKNYVEKGVSLIRNSDIKEGYIRTKDMINLSTIFANQYEGKKMRQNDIVTVHTGDIGTSALITPDLDGCLGFATLQTTVNESLISPNWLMRYFNSLIAKNQFYNFSTGDGRNNLNLKDFIKTKVIVPDTIEEQQKIAEILSSVDDQVHIYKKEKEKYEELKKGLMQQLLTGKIRVKVDE